MRFVTKKSPDEKSKYLKDLFTGTYIKDVLERHKIINDSFRKIVVVRDNIEPWQDDNGIQYIGVEQFLLEEDYLR